MALPHALEEVTRRKPNSIAIAWRGATRWTYDDLRSAIAIVANGLTRRALSPGARIALLLRNSPQYVAAYYGVLSCGFVAVPLNVQERASMLVKQIGDSEADVLIGDCELPEWQSVEAALRHLPIALVGLRLGEGPESFSLLENAFPAPPRLPVVTDGSRETESNALATIIYTSGTTGRPKGVMLSHRNLESNARAIIASLGLTERDHSLCVLPFHFSYGNSVLHSHLLCGARLTLEENSAFPHVLLQRLQDERVSGFAGVPSTFALLLARHRLSDFELGGLRYVTQAGGPMPSRLLAKLREQLPRTRVFVMYGQTEATARLTCLPADDLDRKSGSVGVPVEGVEVEIREGERLVERGHVGEIFVRGPNVMLGYWKDPEATAEVLRDGWLRTRDLGYMDEDGYVFIAGRASDMIKVGAFRVSPQEIEEVLVGFDGVAEAAVVGVPDDLLGQAVKAVIVPRAGAQLAPMTVKAYCREHLASYKVPKIVEFVAALPRTSSGKVQRFKLAGEFPQNGA